MEQDNTILIVTHGNIGKELLDSASMFIKIEQQVHVIGLYADDDINNVHKKVENFISHHAAVLILTDLLSGDNTHSCIILAISTGRGYYGYESGNVD